MPDNNSKQPPRLSDKGKEKQKQRAERRASLLRENLLKRKAQQRLRDEEGGKNR